MPRVIGSQPTGTIQAQQFVIGGSYRGGVNVFAPPQLVNDDDLTIAIDGYLNADGSFRMRNGMKSYNSVTTSGKALILARFYQAVKNGAAVSPETLVLLGQIGNSLYSVGTVTNTLISSISNGVTNASPMTFARIQNPNDPNFVSGLTDCLVICTGSGGPYVYDGTNLYTPAGWADAVSASYCAVVNGILWFGGIPTAPNQIFGTGDGITQSMETLPAFRNFALSSPVMGLCALGTGPTAALVIGCNSGLSVLYGTGPSTFYRQDVPFTDGVTAGRTMVSGSGSTSSGQIFFLGHVGVYSFDGTSLPQQISMKVQPWILNDPFHDNSATDFPMTDRSLAWAQIYNNKLHLGYASYIATPATTAPNTILCYDLIVGGWTVLRPNGGLASMALLDAPSDANPYVAIVGTSTTAQPFTWDFVPSATQNAAYDDAPTNTVPVLAQVQTKYFDLGLPGTTKALMRYYPELFIGGTFNANFVLGVDAGNTTTSALVNSGSAATLAALMWDSGFWDINVWDGQTGFYRFGPQASRIDFNAVEGVEFSFGIQMTATTGALSPWIFTGGTGLYHQRSYT